MSTQAIPIKIYPRLTRGRFNNWRVIAVLVTQLVYLGLPWLTWNGRQAVWFDLPGNQLHLFSLTLWPQDFVYLAALLIFCAIALFWWTALAGRLWCGFSCPQTVYTEIMTWIERWVEGKPRQRQALDAAPWSLRKLRIKGTSHGLMIAFSLVTGFTLVGYFVPIREVATALLGGTLSDWAWFWLLFYAGFTYLLAGRLRESVCKHMCPYARFQGVMFDPDTLVVSYDAVRGEPRGAHRKHEADAARGDCVDCGLCVQVCPTGIDIRAGLQYECIGCAACVDACDAVMDKIGAPRGLIRFATENSMAGRVAARDIPRRMLRPRVMLYSTLMLVVLAGSMAMLLLRTPFIVDVLRDRAFLVRETNDGWLENGYTLRLVNTQASTQRVQLGVEGLPGIRLADAPVLMLPPQATRTVQLRVQASPESAGSGSHPIRFTVVSLNEPGLRHSEDSRFIGE
jgi:cytochrome c oxidase accessory protein FixG